ncbi:MAG: LLM class F420-dependent oxidoreductase [Chloroflexota bacterium]|nr:LLM class F420-dependent oxidoreductase [Chloroflexota bacterium]MCH2675051.1 LLM class F420-dependent oxidoreductase [Dehalococcoidia bacterium]MEC8960407.1 LLM class F420-dependent oxidoreductase [Chloroflexota bacterium]MEC9288593.1 LLM class F420-dependent oxidoreductase [Chloroflexota bacterium]|tara:strand:+ start:68 stop:952 length:885 start_codon:yes stop_codon:yes gene_type:complete
MKTGAVFPQTEIGADPAAVRDYVQAVEELGYSHMMVYDHVLGADTSHHANWQGSYTSESMFHEPFVLFGYLAGITTTIELVTAVLILGQRQTALVAKQAAEVDLLTGGRLRLGVGVGWNHVEYEALNQEFSNRGQRYAEQIRLLREFWTQEVVEFEGRYHKVDYAGVNPQPVQRPIPIWMGAGGRADPVPTDRVLRRVARLADGWFPQMQPGDDARATVERLKVFAKEAGRDAATIGMEPRINLGDGDPEFWQEQAEVWEDMGATHISVNTMRAGLNTPQDHINAIQQFKEVIG